MEEVNLGKYGKLYLIQETFHLLLMMILILNPLKKLIGDPKGQINYFWLTPKQNMGIFGTNKTLRSYGSIKGLLRSLSNHRIIPSRNSLDRIGSMAGLSRGMTSDSICSLNEFSFNRVQKS